MQDCYRVKSLSALSPEVINNPAIYSLLTNKYHQASELGVNMNIECFIDFQKLNMKVYEFTKVLGILLDNAIEAASSSKKKYILIDVYDESNTIIFEISNSYTGKMNLESINIKGYSTKGNKRGLGLYIMNNLLIKCNNIKVEQTVNNRVHIFNTKILVNKK